VKIFIAIELSSKPDKRIRGEETFVYFLRHKEGIITYGKPHPSQ